MKITQLGTVLKISGMDAGKTTDLFAIMVKNEFEKMVLAQTNPKFKELGQKELARMEKFIADHRELQPEVAGAADAMPKSETSPEPTPTK